MGMMPIGEAVYMLMGMHDGVRMRRAVMRVRDRMRMRVGMGMLQRIGSDQNRSAEHDKQRRSQCISDCLNPLHSAPAFQCAAIRSMISSNAGLHPGMKY